MQKAIILIAVLCTVVAFSSCKKEKTQPDIANLCADGIQNNGEAGIDCGGLCASCPKVWTAVSSGTTLDLFSVHFADSMNGWAVGMAGIIIHSADGGNTWFPQNSPITDTLFSVSFANATTGYIAGEKNILKTTNGGVTWSVITSASANQSFYSIQFTDVNKGWVGGSNNNNPFVNHTSSAGVIWLSKFTGSQTGIIRSIDFLNDLRGVAVGTGPTGLIIETDDGGSSWANIGFPSAASLYSCDLILYSDGWAVGIENYYYDEIFSAWQTQNLLPDDVVLRGVKLTAGSAGWAVGNAGTVYKRTGKYVWDKVSYISTTNNLYSVSVSGSTGCITGQAGTMYILK
jgi:photosystem II stability/assembly factor-like uncharacterized protein